jgi:hypothetical protein
MTDQNYRCLFVEIDFTSQMDLVFVRYSETNNNQVSSNQFNMRNFT